MVNTRTDTDLTAAVQNALQALLPQIQEEIREEFRTGSGSSNADGEHTYRYRPYYGCSERLAAYASPDSRGDPRRVLYWIWIVKCWWKPTPVTIHTWLERFNKQKPNSFEKATVP
nr:hypothetical protein [Tanacetum cinerariifolium]